MINSQPDALTQYGWTDRVLALFNEVHDPTLEPARVVRVERSMCAAVFADGTERMLRASALPAAGDWIAAGGERVLHVLPRWSALTRADPAGTGQQVLAANVDLVFITAPVDRMRAARVERELAVAWDSGAQPVVVLTKCDLGPTEIEESLTDRLASVDVVATSAATGRGVSELLRRLLPARTAVLLGPSGAGKSTLANALLGSDVLATGAVRAGDHRGRHTTTSRQLVTIPGGGVLIDTPGLRSLGLTADVNLDEAFPDIDALAAHCRFSDCAHRQEPGCAVLAAVAGGDLEAARLASFGKLQRETAAQARRTDPILRKAQVNVWKSRMKAVRLNDKRRS